jgi:hypothetical protein
MWLSITDSTDKVVILIVKMRDSNLLTDLTNMLFKGKIEW